MIRFLVYEASAGFVKHLEKNGADMEIRYMNDSKFIRELSKVLIDLFRYRVQLAPDQFTEKGFAERKMLLVLDIYDMLKEIKRQDKVDKRLKMKDVKFEHGGEMPVRNYAVIDHTNGLAKKMQFNMNAAMKKISVTC